MMYFYKLSGTNLYLSLLTVATAITGDYLVKHTKLLLYRAIFDNVTHAVIGGLSWLIVCVHLKSYSYQTLLEVALCTSLSSFIDLDHFFSAGSLALQNATQLQSRPPLHNSTIPIVLNVLLVFIAHTYQLRWLLRFAFNCFTAFATHHTRDATRRGYWLYPFGSTPPIPYYVYIILTIAIPYTVCIGFKCIQLDKYLNSSTINDFLYV